MKSNISYVEEKMDKELAKIKVDPDIIGPASRSSFKRLFRSMKSRSQRKNKEEKSMIKPSYSRITNSYSFYPSKSANHRAKRGAKMDSEPLDFFKRFSLQMKKFEKMSKRKKSEYEKFDKKYQTMKKNSRSGDKDIYEWLQIGTKFSFLKKKLRAKVVEMLRDVSNRLKNIEKKY